MTRREEFTKTVLPYYLEKYGINNEEEAIKVAITVADIITGLLDKTNQFNQNKDE